MFLKLHYTEIHSLWNARKSEKIGLGIYLKMEKELSWLEEISLQATTNYGIYNKNIRQVAEPISSENSSQYQTNNDTR